MQFKLDPFSPNGISQYVEPSNVVVGLGGGSDGISQDTLDTALEVKKDKTFLERYRGWNGALAARHNVAARAVLLGDSITQLNASIIAAKTNANFNATGDSNYIPVSSSIPTWTSWGGTYSTAYGLGGWAGELTGSQEGYHTVTCRGFILAYTVQKTGGADLNIYIDNVLQTTINTTDAGISGTTESGRLWTSSAIQYGSHTIKVTRSGSGTVIVDGVFYANGSTSETNLLSNVQVWTAGHTGWKASNFNSTAGNFEAMTTLNPGLIYVHLGTNDYADGLPTFQTNYSTLLDTLEANHPNASFLLVAPYASANRSASGWQDWVDYIKSEADTRGMAFLDLFDVMGDVGNSYDTYGFSDDQVHPNTTGAEIMTNAICDAMYTPGVHLKSPYLQQDGSTELTGGLLNYQGDKGSIGFGAFFGYPVFVGFGDQDDAAAEFWMISSGLASLLGFSQFAIGFGDRTSNPDVHIARPSANTLSIFGSSAAAYGNLLLGNIGIGNGSVGSPALYWRDDPDTGLHYVATNQFSLTAGGVSRVQISALQTVVNPSKNASGDFIVHGDTVDSLIQTDASADALSFWNTTPAAQSTGWSVSNETTTKSFDANATSLDEVADVLGTLIETLKTYGLLGA